MVLPATNIVFWEHVIGLFLLSPIFWRVKNVFTKLTTTDWLNIVSLTIVSSIGGTILFTLALEKSFATGDFVTPLLLQKTQPIIVILLAAVFLKEKITKRYLLFAPLAILGSYLMSFGLAPIRLQLAGRELVFLLAIGAAAAWGSGTIFSKKVLIKLSFVESTCVRFLAAVPLGYAATLLFRQAPTITPLTPDVLGRFFLIGMLTGAGALLIYYKGLARTKANVSTISELTFPFVSILIAITPLNPYGKAQLLTPVQIAGIILLLVSVIAISLEYAKKTARIILKGTVVHGAGDGKKIGIPTANIRITEKPSIPYGVYACRITLGRKTYNSILHFGPRIIFGESVPQYEVHMFNFRKTIYGKPVTLDLKNQIRPTENFSSVAAMKKQIQDDMERAKEYLKKPSI
jgi:drug/metabolite transporter (DMT)-like permease